MSSDVVSFFSRTQRAKLIGLAILVEAFYLLLAFVPASVMAILSAAFYGPERGLLIGLVLLVGVAWIIRPDPNDDREDVELSSVSGLHQLVRSLSADLDAPAIHQIVLDDSPNASAYVSHGFFSLFGVRRKLTVGVPLLRLLNADELKAVIAHELGHFSRKHDRVGQWIYRVQYKWGAFLLMRRSGNDSYIESAQKLVARRLIPYFLRQSSAWSHRCEYEADASAHSVGLSRQLIAALAKLEIYGFLGQHHIQHEMVQWQLQSETPPRAAPEQIFRACQDLAGASLAPALVHAKQHPRPLYDTHPRLHERAQALQVDVETPVFEDVCAGRAILSAEWESVFGAYQSRWHSRHHDAWRFAHFRLRWWESQVNLQVGDKDLQAVAAAILNPSTESSNQLRTLVAGQPSNAYLQYELGRCLLDAQDDAGLQHLQLAIKLNKKMAMASLKLICEYHSIRDSIGLIGRSLDRLAAANRWANGFCGEQLWARFCTEPLEALPQAGRALFARAIENDARIDGCWVGSLQSKEIEGYRFKIHLIVFRLDGANIHEPGKSEDHVRAQMASLLQVVGKPDELIRVKSVFFSEPLNPNLLRNLELHPDVCIVKPKRPFNQNLIKVDSI